MTTRFPATGIDDNTTLPNPTTTSFTSSPSLAGQQGNQNDAIKAVETKLGTGSSTPVANTFLFGTGVGASTWQTLTSAAVLAAVSDETGSGNLVFNTTPTLITPKVDTINESTGGNGVTVAGMNVKAGVIQTSGAVSTAALAAASVTPAKLATGGTQVTVTTNETTTSTSYVDLTTPGPNTTVNIGPNGLALLIWSAGMSNSGANLNIITYSISGATTVAAADSNGTLQSGGTSFFEMSYAKLVTGLNAGSTTFTMKYKASGGTANFQRRLLTVIPL